MARMSARQTLATSRPRFWIYLFGPFLVGLIASQNYLEMFTDWRVYAGLFFWLFPANFLLYGVNDRFDYETDKHNPKKTGYEQVMQPRYYGYLWAGIGLVVVYAAIYSLVLPVAAALALGVFLLLSFAYSVPPVRTKCRPFLDSLTNVLYIVPGWFGYSLAIGQFSEWQLFAAGGVWAMAMHAYSAIPDIQADNESGTATIATVLGKKGTAFFCFVSYTLSAYLAWQALGGVVWLLWLPYGVVMTVSAFATDNQLFRLYALFPWINTVIGALLTLILLLRSL